MYYDYNQRDEECLYIRELKHLPQFYGMSDDDIQAFVNKLNRIANNDWVNNERQRMAQEREKTLALIEEKRILPLSPEPVEIAFGWTICPSWVDERGFIKEDFSKGLKRTIRMSLDKKRIYIN